MKKVLFAVALAASSLHGMDLVKFVYNNIYNNVNNLLKTEEERENKRTIAHKKGSRVQNFNFSSQHKYLYFVLRETNYHDKEKKYSFNTNYAEIYDRKTHEKIKEINNLYTPVTFFNQKNPDLVGYYNERNNQHYFVLHNLNRKEPVTFEVNNKFIVPSTFVHSESLLLLPTTNLKNYLVYNTNQQRLTYYAFLDDITSFRLNKNKECAAITFNERGVYLHNFAKEKGRYLINTKSSATFSPDGTTLVVVDYENNKLKLYDTSTFEQLLELNCEQKPYNEFFKGNGTVVFGYQKDLYCLWDLETNKTFNIPFKEPNYNYLFLKDDRYLNFYLINGDCVMYDIKNKKDHTLELRAYGGDCGVNKEGTYCFITTTHGDKKAPNTAYLYQTKDWQLKKEITFENEKLNPLGDFSPCGNYWFVMSPDTKQIKLYDIVNDRILFTYAWVRQAIYIEYYETFAIFPSKPNVLVFCDYINRRWGEYPVSDVINYISIDKEAREMVISYGDKTLHADIDRIIREIRFVGFGEESEDCFIQ